MPPPTGLWFNAMNTGQETAKYLMLFVGTPGGAMWSRPRRTSSARAHARAMGRPGRLERAGPRSLLLAGAAAPRTDGIPAGLEVVATGVPRPLQLALDGQTR